MKPELELELTFLAKELPREIGEVEPERIVDIYVPRTASLPHLRLRQRGEKYEITKKMPTMEGDYSKQVEQTIRLSREEYLAFLNCDGRRVVKDRYGVLLEGRRAEVDVFREGLEGLVLIDFEFETEEEKANFVMPKVALAEVTQEDFVAGGVLAGKGYEEIKAELMRFNYQKLGEK